LNIEEGFTGQSDPEELQDLYETKKSIATDLQDQLKRKLIQVNQPFA